MLYWTNQVHYSAIELSVFFARCMESSTLDLRVRKSPLVALDNEPYLLGVVMGGL